MEATLQMNNAGFFPARRSDSKF